ncbi:type 1 fimbrial protein [Salmonella enterica]|nr:type 1 fimbrial protein [Salmonella enterica subsp. enterica serovar Sandiego]EIT4520861.1 type 1 fimbrial protein [Salmonella enterica subsp. enterica serovar Sandiego]ELJ4094518.1 type 1 fimbrial protein [Salmonella enterica]QVB78492.1 type 1 fimbrial protein [Salmonella enterica subsp. enterica serovar Rubislaw]
MHSAVAADFDIGLNGRVNLLGSIVSKACAISMDSRYQSIEMARDSVSKIRRSGRGDKRSFSIHLTDCSFDSGGDTPPSPWRYLQVTFIGSNEKGLFTVSGEAGGVSLEITDKNGEVAEPGHPMSFVEINASDMRLDYVLQTKANQEELQSGYYSTVIHYKIDYF